MHCLLVVVVVLASLDHRHCGVHSVGPLLVHLPLDRVPLVRLRLGHDRLVRGRPALDARPGRHPEARDRPLQSDRHDLSHPAAHDPLPAAAGGLHRGRGAHQVRALLSVQRHPLGRLQRLPHRDRRGARVRARGQRVHGRHLHLQLDSLHHGHLQGDMHHILGRRDKQQLAEWNEHSRSR